MKLNHIQTLSVAVTIGWVLSVVLILFAIPVVSLFAYDIDSWCDANPHKVANTAIVLMLMYVTYDCFKK